MRKKYHQALILIKTQEGRTRYLVNCIINLGRPIGFHSTADFTPLTSCECSEQKLA